MSENIILIGFMGTGKDAVGRILAHKLNMVFLSTDEIIELAEGRSIKLIFEQEGEVYFRRKEGWVLNRIRHLKNTVIATGGGMVLSERNCKILKKTGRVIHLYTAVTELKKRIRIDGSRPLIKSTRDLQKLYKKRQGIYDFAEIHISTSKKKPEEISREIMSRLKINGQKDLTERAEILVKAKSKFYPVIISGGIRDNLNAVQIKAMVITNPLVGALYLNDLIAHLRKNGFVVFIKIVPDGEIYKNLETVNKIYDSLFSHNFSRSDLVIGLGGGVITDIAGYVASTYKRGIKLIYIPTTLLAQVDAAIGGKTGVNTQWGKNMLGTFYQPEMVICDIKKLLTLPDSEFKNGISEVIKYGVIKSLGLVRMLQEQGEKILKRDMGILFKIVKECVSIKASIVKQDEKEEQGIREILNFGHTIGHIIETFTHYKKHSHGEAIAIGMVEEIRRFSRKVNSGQKMIINLLKSYGLPVNLPETIKESDIKRLILQDKKIRAGNIKMPVFEDIGKVVVKEVSYDHHYTAPVRGED